MQKKIIDFSKFSSVKIGQECEVFVLDEVCDFDGVMIGGANNTLISPNPPKLGILSQKFDYILICDGVLEIGAATKNSTIFNFARKNNIAGFEFLKSIPGTLGGLVTMNAGLLGQEISQNLISVITSKGEIFKDFCDFEYRKSKISGVIFAAKFEIKRGFNENFAKEIAMKRSNQPKGNSFGSCFVNPSGNYAGALLESVGLKGYKIGNCGFSDKHANFLINYGNGKFDEAIALINLAKSRVFEKFGIELKSEVVIL